MIKNIALLLTGTVNPNKMAFTKLLDVESRKAQYISSIKFWLKNAEIPIVFIENSGFDFSPYFEKEISSNKIEILQFDGNNYPRHLGKGYGELLCLEYAFEHSLHIRNADFIFKVTGRHKVLNFPTFLKQYRENPETSIIVDFYGFMKNCDSKLFGFVPSFIPDYLSKFKNIVNDSEYIFFENILSMSALQAISKGYTFLPLGSFPRIEGSSGTFDIKYNSGYLFWVKTNVEYLLKFKAFK